MKHTVNVVFFVGIILLIMLLVGIAKSQSKAYKEACVSTNGRPVHNGKFWECLK